MQLTRLLQQNPWMATEGAAGAALPLAALQIVWTAAPNDLAYIEGVRHVNGLLLIAALTWLTLGVINGVANGVIARYPVTVADNLQARRIQHRPGSSRAAPWYWYCSPARRWR